VSLPLPAGLARGARARTSCQRSAHAGFSLLERRLKCGRRTCPPGLPDAREVETRSEGNVRDVKNTHDARSSTAPNPCANICADGMANNRATIAELSPYHRASRVRIRVVDRLADREATGTAVQMQIAESATRLGGIAASPLQNGVRQPTSPSAAKQSTVSGFSQSFTNGCRRGTHISMGRREAHVPGIEDAWGRLVLAQPLAHTGRSPPLPSYAHRAMRAGFPLVAENFMAPTPRGMRLCFQVTSTRHTPVHVRGRRSVASAQRIHAGHGVVEWRGALSAAADIAGCAESSTRPRGTGGGSGLSAIAPQTMAPKGEISKSAQQPLLVRLKLSGAGEQARPSRTHVAKRIRCGNVQTPTRSARPARCRGRDLWKGLRCFPMMEIYRHAPTVGSFSLSRRHRAAVEAPVDPHVPAVPWYCVYHRSHLVGWSDRAQGLVGAPLGVRVRYWHPPRWIHA